MSPSEQFCDAQQWAEARFGRVRLGDVRRQRRVCPLVAGWVRQPGASMLQLGTGVAYLCQQGILLHSLAVARWPGSPAQPAAPRPAVALLGLLGQSKSFTKP